MAGYSREFDRQQDELYTAERKVNWSEFGGTEELLNLRDVWVFCNNLMNRKSFANRYPTTHARLAQPKNMKAIAFPQMVMSSPGRYFKSGRTTFHFGGVAGGYEVTTIDETTGKRNWLSAGAYSPDFAYLADHYSQDRNGLPHTKKLVKGELIGYRPSGIQIYPGKHGGHANNHGMWLDRWARKKWIIIHELAHTVNHNENGSPNSLALQGHGWQFCAIYLQLVQMAFGIEAKKALKAEFRNGNVRHLKPRGAKNMRPGEAEQLDRWIV